MLKLGTLKISYVFTFILVLILSLFLNITFLAINSIFLRMLKQILQESFFSTFVLLIPVNLNQYRRTVGVFNNRNIAICHFCNIWYSQSFRNCSTFIFFNAIFIYSLSICSLRVFKVFIFKFIKSKVSHNSHMLESNFIHQYISTIY